MCAIRIIKCSVIRGNADVDWMCHPECYILAYSTTVLFCLFACLNVVLANKFKLSEMARGAQWTTIVRLTHLELPPI